jgi:hypothetical protein
VEKGKGNTIGLKPKSWRHFADGYLLTCERVVSISRRDTALRLLRWKVFWLGFSFGVVATIILSLATVLVLLEVSGPATAEFRERDEP